MVRSVALVYMLPIIVKEIELSTFFSENLVVLELINTNLGIKEKITQAYDFCAQTFYQQRVTER